MMSLSSCRAEIRRCTTSPPFQQEPKLHILQPDCLPGDDAQPTYSEQIQTTPPSSHRRVVWGGVKHPASAVHLRSVFH